MPTIKVEIDTESYERLIVLAVAERRPIAWQAEVLLMRALALPGPPLEPPPVDIMTIASSAPRSGSS